MTRRRAYSALFSCGMWISSELTFDAAFCESLADRDIRYFSQRSLKIKDGKLDVFEKAIWKSSCWKAWLKMLSFIVTFKRKYVHACVHTYTRGGGGNLSFHFYSEFYNISGLGGFFLFVWRWGCFLFYYLRGTKAKKARNGSSWKAEEKQRISRWKTTNKTLDENKNK